jgi:hypothetical protein
MDFKINSTVGELSLPGKFAVAEILSESWSKKFGPVQPLDVKYMNIEECKDKVIVFTVEGVTFHLIGINHYLPECSDLVATVIRETKPDVVLLEVYNILIEIYDFC